MCVHVELTTGGMMKEPEFRNFCKETNVNSGKGTYALWVECCDEVSPEMLNDQGRTLKRALNLFCKSCRA